MSAERDDARIVRAILRYHRQQMDMLFYAWTAKRLALLLLQRAHRRAAVERGGYD